MRGRGRGKYVCEECGIRCKKPSMLKKHIRTHTDVRPYVCRHCHFAFKTKGKRQSAGHHPTHGRDPPGGAPAQSPPSARGPSTPTSWTPTHLVPMAEHNWSVMLTAATVTQAPTHIPQPLRPHLCSL